MTEKECPLSAKPQTPAAPPVVLTKIKAGRIPSIVRTSFPSASTQHSRPIAVSLRTKACRFLPVSFIPSPPLPRAESSRYRRVQWEEAMTEIRLRRSCASQSHRHFSMSGTGMPTSRSVCGTPTSSMNEIFHSSSFSITKRTCKKRPLKATGDGVQEGFRLRLFRAGSKMRKFKEVYFLRSAV